jgi:hypothetical protein
MVPGWNWRLYQMVNQLELVVRARIRTTVPNALIAAMDDADGEWTFQSDSDTTR